MAFWKKILRYPNLDPGSSSQAKCKSENPSHHPVMMVKHFMLELTLAKFQMIGNVLSVSGIRTGFDKRDLCFRWYGEK